MKEKLKTTSFWLGLCGAVVLIVECVADIFNIKICSDIIENIVVTICSVLVMLGIVTKKNVGDTQVSSKEDLLQEINNAQDIDKGDSAE